MKEKNETNFTPMRKKTFENSLKHLFRTEYGFLGGDRVLSMIVKDIMHLIDEYYIPTERLKVGQIIWPGISTDEHGAFKKKIEDYKIKPVILNLITQEDLYDFAQVMEKKEIDKKRAVRILNEAFDKGVLLTYADISILLNKAITAIGRHIRDYENETKTPVPCRGVYHDVGKKMSHKGIINRKRIEDKASISRISEETHHSPEAVTRYIGDLGKVKLAMERGLSNQEICYITDIRPYIFKQYKEIVKEHFPDIYDSFVKKYGNDINGGENAED
jgi:hypothetical protein